MTKSPYFIDIIPYSGNLQTKPLTTKNESLLLTEPVPPGATTRNATPLVHGFHLNEDEAFSSTRYFSEDKKSYARIIAKDGAFQATYQNLNDEHKNDLVFEMSFQFLLNLPPDKKTINLRGSPEMVHRMHAALLYLQKEAGTRYADLTIVLPEGISVAKDELEDDYIKKHLGELHETPQQVVKWRDFLAIKPNIPQTSPEAVPLEITTPEGAAPKATTQSSQNEQIKRLIDMERVFDAPELSQEDKIQLNEYQRYLKDTWVYVSPGSEKNTQYLITKHEEFMQRTETALPVFKKAPSLEKEYEALKMLYVGTTETHLKLMEELRQNDIAYETQLKKLLPQLLKAKQEALEDCLSFIEERLEEHATRQLDLSLEHQESLLKQQQSMKEIKQFIEEQPELTDEMLHSFCTQAQHMMSFLESINDNQTDTQPFQERKKFLAEQSEKKLNLVKTAPEILVQTSNHIKERLNQFKKNFQEPKTPELLLDADAKEKLDALMMKVDRFIKTIKTEEGRKPLEQVFTTMEQIYESSRASKEQVDKLHQDIDNALLGQDNPPLAKLLSKIKDVIKTPSISAPLSQEENNLLRND